MDYGTSSRWCARRGLVRSASSAMAVLFWHANTRTRCMCADNAVPRRRQMTLWHGGWFLAQATSIGRCNLTLHSVASSLSGITGGLVLIHSCLVMSLSIRQWQHKVHQVLLLLLHLRRRQRNGRLHLRLITEMPQRLQAVYARQAGDRRGFLARRFWGCCSFASCVAFDKETELR